MSLSLPLRAQGTTSMSLQGTQVQGQWRGARGWAVSGSMRLAKQPVGGGSPAACSPRDPFMWWGASALMAATGPLELQTVGGVGLGCTMSQEWRHSECQNVSGIMWKPKLSMYLEVFQDYSLLKPPEKEKSSAFLAEWVSLKTDLLHFVQSSMFKRI